MTAQLLDGTRTATTIKSELTERVAAVRQLFIDAMAEWPRYVEPEED